MNRSIPESSHSYMKKLNGYLNTLEKADIENFSRPALLAFWINAYNAFTVKLILNNYPLKSIKDIKKPWKQKIWIASGKRLSLDDIEHEILRKKFKEPRIHFAIVCASKGCPPLYGKAYQSKTIMGTLNEISRSFFTSPRNFSIEQSGDVVTVYLNRIFKWFGDDFGRNNQERIDFIRPYLSTNYSDMITGAGKINVKYLDYDWSLNGK